jgi:thiamine pyrophosphate-dependent acetolactate synthase large subunit-like protein
VLRHGGSNEAGADRIDSDVGGAKTVGPKAVNLLDIGRPEVDWVALANSFGVEATRARSMEELSRCIDAGLAAR